MKPNLTLSKFSLLPIVTVLGVIIIGISCQKSSVTEKQSDNSLNQQKLNITNSLIEASTSDEDNFNMVMENDESMDALNVSNAKVAGKTVTFSPSKHVYPHTKTIDYGAGFTDSQSGPHWSGAAAGDYRKHATAASGESPTRVSRY